MAQYKEKFDSLEEFLKSKAFETKTIEYCDLSNLDLSVLPESTWSGFIFSNSNFANTGIRFDPNNLKKYENEDHELHIQIHYCDFTNVDLSYWEEDMLDNISVKGCNFTNTNLKVRLCIDYGDDDTCICGSKSYEDCVFPDTIE